MRDEGPIGIFFGKLWIGFGDEVDDFDGISLDKLGSGGGVGGGSGDVVSTII